MNIAAFSKTTRSFLHGGGNRQPNIVYYGLSFSVFSKGTGLFGALGQGDSLNDSKQFCELFVEDCKINDGVKGKSIATGWGHSAIVTNLGALFIFGRPYDFSNIMQLNRVSKLSKTLAKYVARTTNSAIFGERMGYFPVPTPIVGLDGVISVSCSAGLTIALTTKGDIYGFGLNRWRQCGVYPVHSNVIHVYEPTLVSGLPRCIEVDTGLQHCIALSEDGHVYTWGKATRGQLGRSVDDDHSLPAEVGFPESKFDSLRAIKVCAGFSHSGAIGTDGAVYIWGKGFSTTPSKQNNSFRVFDDQLVPRKIELPSGRRAVDIVSSNFNVVIAADDASLWAMGVGEYDRNMNNFPLRVQTDYHDLYGAVKAEGEEAESNIYVVLSKNTILCKGYNRVCAVFPDEIRKFNQSKDGCSTISACYEIVIHKDEAYLKEVSLGEYMSQDGENRHYDVREFSSGWQHSLLSVDSLANFPKIDSSVPTQCK